MTVLFCTPAAMNESSCCFTSLTAFNFIRVLDFGYYHRCVVVSYCFYLQLPNDLWCRASFHTLIAFCISSLPFLKLGCPFSYYWVLRVLYILDDSTLSDISFTNIFSQFLGYLLIFLTVSFIEKEFVILLKSSLSIVYFMVLAFDVISKKSFEPRII